jgi:CO/xanthine dehydrogenase FAD-binding subunit
MLLPQFEFFEPVSTAEACEIMARYAANARVLAGGTDLLVNMKKKVLRPSQLVSLARIEDLKQVDSSDNELIIGAGYTVAEIALSPLINQTVRALGAAARALGTPLIRNLATIGGNIGSARPAADLPPALIVYGASLTLKNTHGERRMAVEEFFKGPGMTAIAPDEIVTEIRITEPRGRFGAGYLNLGVRKAQDCNIVNVASFLSLDENGKRIQTARIAMGSVGPTPFRAYSAEKLLMGAKPEDALFKEAARTASQDCTPIIDFRGSAEYRRVMVAVLTQRTLGIALNEAQSRRQQRKQQ